MWGWGGRIQGVQILKLLLDILSSHKHANLRLHLKNTSEKLLCTRLFRLLWNDDDEFLRKTTSWFIYGNNWLICNRNLKTSLSLMVYFCGFWIAWAFLCFIYRSVPCKFCLCTRVSERDFPLITSDGKALNSIWEQKLKRKIVFSSHDSVQDAARFTASSRGQGSLRNLRKWDNWKNQNSRFEEFEGSLAPSEKRLSRLVV